MKKIATLMGAALLSMAATAQTLNIATGNVTWHFPAAEAGDMTYADGTSLTVMGKTFTISDITAMTVDQTEVTPNSVSVSYDGTQATVSVAGNVAQFVSVETSGAHVNIAQSADVDATVGEITYTLSGTTTDGEFYLSGSYKTTVELDGLTLTNATPVWSGAAVHIQNGKRIDISVKKGTTNTLTDCADGSQKGCLYVKGHPEFKGKGTLNVYAQLKHGIKAGEYMEMKNCTINILSAPGDGVNCSQYFLIESGELNVSGTADDGVQCDLDGTESTGELAGHEDEDSGNVYIAGGTITVSVTAAAAKAVKCEGDMVITAGTVSCTTSGGGTWDSTKLKTKASACLSADGNMTVSGGTLTLASTGAGGKGISVDGNLTVSDEADITVSTSGNAVVASSSGTLSVVTNSRTLDNYTTSYKSSPKGIKADGVITIAGGRVKVTTTGTGGEGIESKDEIIISGGEVIVNASDDAINAAYKKNDQKQKVSGSGDMTITGGYVYACSSGNDGLDSNGNTYIKGGLVYAIGASSPELAIDANTEEGKKLYITGGTIIAVGGLESGSSISGGTAKQATSWTGNTWHALYSGGTLVAAFKTPANSSSGGGGGWGPGGGGSSRKLVVYTASTPTLKSGVSVSGGTDYFDSLLNVDGTVSGGSSVTLSNYSSGGGGGWW